jgi:hypothetical protein
MAEQRYYAVADVTHKHSNYEFMSYSVLTNNKPSSIKLWGTITKNTSQSVDYESTIITTSDAQVRKFIKNHMDSWAQDPNMYGNTLVMIQQLRYDLQETNPGYNRDAWTKLVNEYAKLTAKYHEHMGGKK